MSEQKGENTSLEPLLTIEEAVSKFLLDSSHRFSPKDYQQLEMLLKKFEQSLHAKEMQKWLLENHNEKQNLFAKYFFNGILHLSQVFLDTSLRLRVFS